MIVIKRMGLYAYKQPFMEGITMVAEIFDSHPAMDDLVLLNEFMLTIDTEDGIHGTFTENTQGVS